MLSKFLFYLLFKYTFGYNIGTVQD